MKHTRGFTLVELLITAGIIAVVLITAGTFLVQSQRSQLATVDLSSRNDARAFVSSLLNYDFRIVCYQEGDEPCEIQIDNPGEPDVAIEIFYREDRFGENEEKTVRWEMEKDDLVRIENSTLRSVVLQDIKSFEVHRPERQLLEFTIERANDPKPIRVNVAILNEVQGN